MLQPITMRWRTMNIHSKPQLGFLQWGCDCSIDLLRGLQRKPSIISDTCLSTCHPVPIPGPYECAGDTGGVNLINDWRVLRSGGGSGHVPFEGQVKAPHLPGRAEARSRYRPVCLKTDHRSPSGCCDRSAFNYSEDVTLWMPSETP
jgi:hypothetical protein